MADKTVVLVGTLDTKGREYAFLRDRLHAAGVGTILVDAGIMGPPLVAPDVSREEDEIGRASCRERVLVTV